MVKYLLALKHLPIQPHFAKKICSFCSAWTLSTLSSFIVNPDLLLIKDDTLFFRNIILIVDFPVVFFNLILNWSLLTSNVQINLQQDCLKLSKSVVRGKIVLIWFGGGGIGKSGPAGLGENRQQWIFDKATQLWEKSYKSQILWLW